MTEKNRKKIMRKRKRTLALIGLCLMIQIFAGAGVPIVYAESPSESILEPTGLYAQAAVLMDADSGRILFEKNGQEERATASTTKIMTCILALESGNLDKTVTASANAAKQPKVHLGVREGQEFVLRDLLYSLMLESHNDSAVVIAEAVGKTVEGFADMMNAKAKALNCDHTYFITPNGLDSADATGKHHTTAEDLARIMKYCIMDSPQKEVFLEITRTPTYQFSDKSGKQSYFCSNHNAFLQMMEGALSGKTGFTSEAGYCYVGALESQGRTFVVALLACGWPNNKGYKWADTRKLMVYGMEHFHYKNVYQELQFEPIEVLDGIPNGNCFSGKSFVTVEQHVPAELAAKGEKQKIVKNRSDTKKSETKRIEIRWLLRDDDEVRIEQSVSEKLTAPVEKGKEVGIVRILLNGEEQCSYPIVTAESVRKRSFSWCLEKVIENILF